MSKRVCWTSLSKNEQRRLLAQATEALCNTYKDQEPHMLDRNYQEGGDHYTSMPVQPWDVVDCWPVEQRVGYYRGNAIKYLMRLGAKGGSIEDARKAQHYTAKLIDLLRDE